MADHDDTSARNLSEKVIRDFGDEWTEYDQSDLSEDELATEFDDYFHIFPWDRVDSGSVGADIGCGSGRWAAFVAPRVGRLLCVEPSHAIEVARRNLKGAQNVDFIHADIDRMPIDDESLDFAYCLGVLHHLPDPAAGMRRCVDKLKRGAPFLAYLYYRFDNRPAWYRMVWRASDLLRRVIQGLPHRAKVIVTTVIAGLVYYPLARLALMLEKAGIGGRNIPLGQYRHNSFSVMRACALDRFGTAIEHRFTRDEIRALAEASGLCDLSFTDRKYFWCFVGYRAD
ncbi:MAG: methyltransferase domain-containing protein [Rhodospirillales bacterium]